MRYAIEAICQAHGHSRQGYYKRLKLAEAEQKENERILDVVRAIRKREPRVGGKKLHKRLRREGIVIGRDRLFDILRGSELLIRAKKRYVKTTNSQHWLRKYSNLVKTVAIVRPEQVYVADITYLDTLEGFCYLSLITDAYSRKIMGWAVSESLSIEGSVEALAMALVHTRKTEGLIHHSDRGIQYCSKGYVAILQDQEMKISMTEENHVYENALAERVNGILKSDFLLCEQLGSIAIARKMVKEAIDIYNNERLHMAIDYMTPSEKHVA